MQLYNNIAISVEMKIRPMSLPLQNEHGLTWGKSERTRASLSRTSWALVHFCCPWTILVANLVLERRKALKRLFNTLQPLPRMLIYHLLRGRRPSEVLVLTLCLCHLLGFLEVYSWKKVIMHRPRRRGTRCTWHPRAAWVFWRDKFCKRTRFWKLLEMHKLSVITTLVGLANSFE